MDLDVSVRILEMDGTTVVLDLTDAAGYEIGTITMPARTWRRSIVTADDVEGDEEQQAVLDAGIYQLTLKVRGSSHSQVDTRRANLIAAVEQRRYLLEVTVEGQTMTWRARKADSSTGTEQHDLIGMTRPMTLQIPVQPRTVEES